MTMVKTLEELISNADIERISRLPNVVEKLTYLEKEENLRYLKSLEFSGENLYPIFRSSDWKDKLDWARDNFEGVLKPMEFNGYHYSQIVRNKDWKDKLDWVSKKFDKRFNNGYRSDRYDLNNSQFSKIIKGKDWRDKLAWVLRNYDSKKHNSSDIQKALIKKDWRKEVGKFAA